MVQCATTEMNGTANPAAMSMTAVLLAMKNKVQIRNPELVESKIAEMAKSGVDKLMIISDFDYTLSRYHNNGQKCATTHGLFEQIARETNPEFLQQINELRHKYVPIEYCPTMKMEEKIPFMESWWRQSHELIVKYKASRELMRSAVEKTQEIQLRDGCSDLLHALYSAKVPLVIFSAGIGQIIEYMFEFHAQPCPQPSFSNQHIISNFMVFSNEDDVCVGFTEPLIHTFNKNSTVVKQEAPFFHQIANRTSILLLGDSLGDVHMDVGVEKESVVLKIGYLNFNFDSLLERYLDEYDIVLIDDQSMDVPSRILSHVMQNSEPNGTGTPGWEET